MASQFQVDTGETLTTSLVGYYECSSRYDYYTGAKHLTNNGGVTFATGKVLNCADFGTGADRSLRITDNLGITSGSISMSGWFNISSAPTSGNLITLMSHTDASVDINNAVYYWNVAGTLKVVGRRTRSGIADYDVAVTQTLTIGTWYYITYTYNSSTGDVYLYINGSANGPTTANTANGNNDANNITGFAIGEFMYSGSPRYLTGKADEVGVWSKVLSQTEIDDLYNGGSGQTLLGVAIKNPSHDGRLIYTGSADWATTRDAATGIAVQTAETNGKMVVVGKDGGGTFNLQRAGFTFDTSAIGAGSTITSATLAVYVTATGNGDNDGQDYLSVVGFTPANAASFATADYDQFGTTKLSDDKDISSISTSAYLTFTLNASGLAAISKTGNTVLGIREGHDIENAAYAGGSGTYNYIDANWTDNATNKPVLTINYTTVQNLTLTADYASFSLSGQAAGITRALTSLVASVGTYILTGLSATFSFRGWTEESKNTPTWTETNVNTASWSEESKNTPSWTEENVNH